MLSACAFGGCSVGEATVQYTLSEDGTHYILSGVGGDKRGLTEYEVPASYAAEEGGELLPVTEIGDKAFSDCYRLSSVTLPDTVTKIGVNAFLGCAFSQFTIPESVKEIGYAAFGLCDALKEITIPESVETLEKCAFSNCAGLEKAVVRATITVLDYKVFYNNMATQGSNVYTDTSLTEVYLPATLQKINVWALTGNFISDIYFAGSEEQWDGLYFYEDVKNDEDKLEEKKYEKSEVLKGIKMHFNAEF